MKNIEKYPNTNDALEAYNSLAFKTVSFDTWLECEFEEPHVPTLLEAAAEMVYAWRSEVTPGYTARFSKAIGRLSDAIEREKCKPVRNVNKYKAAEEAASAFSRIRRGRKGGCEMLGKESTCEKSSQVGSVAAMREALNGALEAVKTLSKTHNDDLPEDVRVLLGGIAFDATAALSTPPRNCDVGTAEEQSKRFLKFCYGENCSKCPVHDAIICKCAWSQLPYEKGETK